MLTMKQGTTQEIIVDFSGDPDLPSLNGVEATYYLGKSRLAHEALFTLSIGDGITVDGMTLVIRVPAHYIRELAGQYQQEMRVKSGNTEAVVIDEPVVIIPTLSNGGT